MFGIPPPFPVDCNRIVADWLFKHLSSSSNASNIEIEAKVGTIIDSETHTRLQLPIFTETVLLPNHQQPRSFYFESNITKEQHCKVNTFLNKLVSSSCTSSTSDSGSNSKNISYLHTKYTDAKYDLPKIGKCRATFDSTTGQLKALIRKERVEDLHIYFPRGECDIRISISTETPIPITFEIEGMIKDKRALEPPRLKNRISYKNDTLWIVDLTQVFQGINVEKFELELEIANVALLQKESRKLLEKQNSAFGELCKSFVGAVRFLLEKVGKGEREESAVKRQKAKEGE